MNLTDVSRFPSFSFSPLKKHRKVYSKELDLLSRSFDEFVLYGLKELDPPAISLSWLSHAVDFLDLIHTEAISSMKVLEESRLISNAPYLDNFVKILDVCNSISSEIENLRHRRLRTNFLLHLLKSDPLPAREKISRAIDSSSATTTATGTALKRRVFPVDLVRDLAFALDNAPKSETSTLRLRRFYAVGLLTAFVVGVISAVLYGSPSLVEFRVPSEFLWADSFHGIQSTISSELKRRFVGEGSKEERVVELDDVESVIKKALEAMDELSTGKENREKFNGAVREVDRVVGIYSEKLDRLCDGVNGIFQTVLSSRKEMLENFRGKEKKNPTKKK